MKVRLERLSSSHNNLRDTFITGRCETPPAIGECFFMVAPPRDKKEPGMVRTVTTTPVTKVKKEGTKFYFETRNSSYALELVGGDDDGSF